MANQSNFVEHAAAVRNEQRQEEEAKATMLDMMCEAHQEQMNAVTAATTSTQEFLKLQMQQMLEHQKQQTEQMKILDGGMVS